MELARVVELAARRAPALRPCYSVHERVFEKIAAVARKVYGAGEVDLAPRAQSMLDIIEKEGLGHLPVCIAKTSLSLSHDAGLRGTPRGFTLPISEVRPAAGAGYIVAETPHARRMPGLPEVPAVDLD